MINVWWLKQVIDIFHIWGQRNNAFVTDDISSNIITNFGGVHDRSTVSFFRKFSTLAYLSTQVFMLKNNVITVSFISNTKFLVILI